MDNLQEELEKIALEVAEFADARFKERNIPATLDEIIIVPSENNYDPVMEADHAAIWGGNRSMVAATPNRKCRKKNGRWYCPI